MNPTELRQNIYKILDTIAATGKPVEIHRKGITFKIIRETPGKLDRLRSKDNPKAYSGNSDELVSKDWSSEWKPKHI